jgi:zinc protease
MPRHGRRLTTMLTALTGIAFLVAACASAPQAPVAPAPPIGEAALPVDSRISTGTLDNGLTWYVLPHRKPEARAQLWLVVDAGAVLEDDDQRGLAHFVEHMAFNGTETYPKQEIVDYIEGVGMRFGPDLNAYTSFDETVYMLQVPTDDDALVDKGLDILREWAGHIAFDADEVEKERGVVLEEWRLGRGAWGRVRDRQYPLLMHGSRYAERLPIGEPSIIETASRETLVRYYRDWYRPDLMAVVAVGDFDRDGMIAKIRETFSGLEPAVTARQRPVFRVPPHDETLVSAVTDDELPSTSVSVVTKLDARSQSTRKDYRRGIVDRLYSSMMNARFFELSQQPDAPFLRAGMGFGGLTRTTEQIGRSAGAKEGRVLDALRVLVEETSRVEQHGFTETELERAKTSYLRGVERSALERDKTDGRAFASEITRHFLEAEAMPGIEAELEMTREMLPSISLDEVNALARATSGTASRVILLTGPSKTPLPDSDVVLAVVEAAGATELAAWEDVAPVGPLVAREPAPGRIVAERGVPELGVTEWTLSNGARVVVKPTDFQNDSVSFSAWSPGGDSLVPDEEARVMGLATTVVNESGLGTMSTVALRKALTGKVASARPYIGQTEEGFWGGGSPEDLETLLQLVWLHFNEPRLDPEAITAWKNRTIESLRNELLDPNTVFFREFQNARTGGHPRARPLTIEDVEAFDAERALSFYRERFADAGDFTFFFVGNLDLERMRPLVELWLGSLPSTGRTEEKRVIDIPFPSGVTNVDVPKGIEPKSRVRVAFGGATEWTREAELDARLLNEVLNIRLREILREDMGGVYGVRISGGISRELPQTFNFEVQFGCAPEQVEPLTAAVFDVIRDARANGIGEVYLGKVRETWKRTREIQLKQNTFWLNALAWAWQWDDDLVANLDLEKSLARVTSENVKAAANRYLDPDNHVLGVLRPAE